MGNPRTNGCAFLMQQAMFFSRRIFAVSDYQKIIDIMKQYETHWLTLNHSLTQLHVWNITRVQARADPRFLKLADPTATLGYGYCYDELWMDPDEKVQALQHPSPTLQ